jgi:hypothetical protein
VVVAENVREKNVEKPSKALRYKFKRLLEA